MTVSAMSFMFYKIYQEGIRAAQKPDFQPERMLFRANEETGDVDHHKQRKGDDVTDCVILFPDSLSDVTSPDVPAPVLGLGLVLLLARYLVLLVPKTQTIVSVNMQQRSGCVDAPTVSVEQGGRVTPTLLCCCCCCWGCPRWMTRKR